MNQTEHAEELGLWWRQKAEQEINATIPKAVEYGSVDLDIIGHAMLQLLPDDAKRAMTGEQKRRMGAEMGIAFYALGKVARLISAYQRGVEPSDDTWFDLGVYAKMAQRVREHGEWS